MKITSDTNTLISATFWYGDSFRIITMVENKKLDLILSKSIIKEFFGVLHYNELQEKIKHFFCQRYIKIHVFDFFFKHISCQYLFFINLSSHRLPNIRSNKVT